MFWNYLINNTNNEISSFKIMLDTMCCKQINDFTFEDTQDLVKKGETFDAQLVFKKGNPYLCLGFDNLLEYEVFVPIKQNNNQINVIFR